MSWAEISDQLNTMIKSCHWSTISLVVEQKVHENRRRCIEECRYKEVVGGNMRWRQ